MTRRLVLAAVLAVALAAGSAPIAASKPRIDPTRLAKVTRVFYAVPRAPRTGVRSLSACPNATTCTMHKLGRARWPVDATGRLAMPYRYSDIGRPARAPAADVVRAAVRASAAEWHRWNSNVSYVDTGTTTSRPGARGPRGGCGDGINTIGWKTMSAGALGVAIICYDPATRQIAEADTALNSALGWANFAGPTQTGNTFDVRSIITHELGHWLSLLDLYTSRSRLVTMHGGDQPGSISKRTLALGDIVGAQTAYPCGDGDVCPRTGIVAD